MMTQAVRGLLRDPRFVVLAVLTLACGLGAAAAAFAVLDAVLLRALPFPQAERLVAVWHTAPGLDIPRLDQSDGTYLLYRESPAFEDFGVYRLGAATVTGSESPEQLTTGWATPSLMRLLGLGTVVGRVFDEDEGRPGSASTVMLSHGLWTRRFGRDPEIVGRSLTVDGVPRRIVGVLKSSFRFPSPDVELWLPQVIDPQATQAGSFRFPGIARLNEGADPESVRRDLRPRMMRIPELYPEARMSVEMLGEWQMEPVVLPLRDEIVGDVRPTLWALAGAVGLLLVVACSNVATLFVVRIESRRPELAVRSALGASRGEVVRMVLAEAASVGLIAGGLALALASSALRFLARFGPEELPSVRAVAVDARTVAFTLGVGLTVTCVTAVVTILRRAPSPARVLRGWAPTSDRHRQRLRRGLVIVQVALATVLWVAAGLMVRSFTGLLRVDPGFRPEGVVSLRVDLPAARYGEAETALTFYHRLLRGLRELPGVVSAGAVNHLPLAVGGHALGFTVEDFPLQEDEALPVFPVRWASSDYFETLGVSLLRGRPFEPDDARQVRPVAIVSRTFAERFWGDGDPVGKRLALGAGDDRLWRTIVGVVDDVRTVSLEAPPDGVVYLPLVSHLPRREAPYASRRMHVVVESGVTPDTLAADLRRLFSGLDPDLPVVDLVPIEHLVADSRAPIRFTHDVLVAAAVGTGLLSAVGLYGLLAVVVSRRRRELGIRLALGASRGQVRRHVLRDGLAMVGVGITFGLVAALLASRWLKSLLYEVAPTDPWAYVTAAVLFAGLAALACDVPARRAARVDPQSVLRE